MYFKFFKRKDRDKRFGEGRRRSRQGFFYSRRDGPAPLEAAMRAGNRPNQGGTAYFTPLTVHRAVRGVFASFRSSCRGDALDDPQAFPFGEGAPVRTLGRMRAGEQ